MESIRTLSKISLWKVKFGLLIFLNILILVLGITILILDFNLWNQIRNFNSFILTLMLISFYIISVTVFGLVKLKNSENCLLIYFVMISIMWLGFLIMTLYIHNNKINLITFLLKNMDD
jgi:hypothetical protein